MNGKSSPKLRNKKRGRCRIHSFVFHCFPFFIFAFLWCYDHCVAIEAGCSRDSRKRSHSLCLLISWFCYWRSTWGNLEIWGDWGLFKHLSHCGEIVAQQLSKADCLVCLRFPHCRWKKNNFALIWWHVSAW